MTSIFEKLFLFLEANAAFLNGFTMAGVILVLVGIQSITKKDLKEYFKNRKDLHKIDHYIAWGIFYIIFGTLITVSSVLTVSLYINK